MRFSALLAPGLVVLAGAGYFIARPKDTNITSVETRLERAPSLPADNGEDDADAATVRNAINARNLTDEQSTALVSAAGRRYIRRKMAYDQAVAQGNAPARTLDFLRKEVELSRKVCDLVESIGRRPDEVALQAEIDIERSIWSMPGALAERHDGRVTFTDADLKTLQHDFMNTFHRPLPVSAHGETALHRSMGFDHRGRTDVAVGPETTEGVWLRHYLTEKGASFFAFRSAAVGKATGAHIHIGPASGHAKRGG